jgi:hypothetical protein
MTTEELLSMDRQRERWDRARRSLHLQDVENDAFGTGGIAARLPDLSVRLVILPADPDARRVEFDEAFVAWWMGDFDDPIAGTPMRWGTSYRPSATAAARCEPAGDGAFYRYAAVRHDGGLDVGLGTECGCRNKESAAFWLLPTVGRVWSACHLYNSVIQRLEVDGPWELTLALRGTRQAVLGGFAEGWEEPEYSFRRAASICEEQNLILRRELPSLGDDWARSVAFSFGAQIEDAFGSKLRRFKADRGKFAREFDRGKYRWE